MEKYTCWSPVVSMWIICSYRGIQLFVWLFMCEIREHTRHETVMKRTLGMMMMMNALISHNYTASGRAALMNYVYSLNFAYLFFQVCMCALWSNCNTRLHAATNRHQSVEYYLSSFICSSFCVHFINLHNMYRFFSICQHYLLVNFL